MSKQLVSGKHRLRNTYWSLVGAASATILSVQPVMAETIWDRFSTIMRDIYGQLVGISTIVAVTVAAIALLVRMVSRNQRAVDEATSWLKRVVVTWIILNTLGFIGYITSVTRDDTDSVLTVDFGDGRIAEYDGSDLEMLDLAYASTIHKSQGSEYKSVIINLQCAHAVMLVRPLVYTAITRAKERVLIVGERRALCIAIKRTDTEQRGTMLSARIKELISNVKGDHYNGNLAQ